MKKLLYILILSLPIVGISQENKEIKEQKQKLKASTNLTYDANKELVDDNFIDAEANYRKAIAASNDNAAAKFNLGNAYYKENSFGEAFVRYKQAGETAQTKEERHSAYHNLGNVFMKNKEYDKAIEAYKEALRNDPSDEETRYNLALAKEMKKKDDQQKQNDKNNDDKNKDKDNQDQQQNKNDQDQDDNQNKNDQQNQDNKENDQNSDKNKEQKGDEGKDQEDKNPKPGDQPKDQQDPKQQPPRPNQLSPQQIKNILEAMSNEEKKVQEKINGKKVKGKPAKNAKDW
ncbi:O-phosphoseryl-tRNA(Sec) selenium transferase, SepSecS [Zhouia amylolytica]|uniref:O-phosphoseryl-tRNA(Sec) selenium transferase, SepSecS n=1 Tax=Zhouia amylolytica TaxID=376730 RepID=A0A1I6SF96_9FLAO|nr:tetratricopeptide repeat protein [Zhouia amylolytica]SFS75607.1 O-phosphoseryl-tRNA(Sec) selenium transferase, SepSecS [Zhouia amylolytica]